MILTSHLFKKLKFIAPTKFSFVSAKNGHLHVLKALVASGIDLRNSLLNVAVSKGRTEVVKFILESGFTPTERSVIEASRGGHTEVLKLLLAHNAPVSDIALYWACNNDIDEKKAVTKEIVKLLKEYIEGN